MAVAIIYKLSLVFLSLLVAQCFAQSKKRDLVKTTDHGRDTFNFIPLESTSGKNKEDLEMLNVVLLASVDGKLHALDRSTGEILWSMSSSGTSPSALGPLVRTQHTATHFTDDDEDVPPEFYVIEPQSGNIYVTTKNGPLQLLPLSMAQLVELSPFSFAGEEDKVFVGKKETSLLLLELETGRIKATINSECPWDPFEDPFEDLKEAEALDLDELDGSKPSKPEKPTEVFIGRTDYHISIHTKRTSPLSPRLPVQNLSFSIYGPNNQDIAFQSVYRRTLDDMYIQPSSNGRIMSFRIQDKPDQDRETGLLWGMSFPNPIVAVMDVVKGPSRQHPFVLLQPSPRLQEVFPSIDFSTAHLPNQESAFVGIVEESGSLFAMSPEKFPLVVFGDAATPKTIDPPPGSRSPSNKLSDLDSITKARKLRELCERGSLEPKCMIGVRKLENGGRSRLNRLLDGVPSVMLPPGPEITTNESPEPIIEHVDIGHTISSNHSNLPSLPPAHSFKSFGIVSLFLPLLLYIGWFAAKKSSSSAPTLRIKGKAVVVGQTPYISAPTLDSGATVSQGTDNQDQPMEFTTGDEKDASERDDVRATPSKRKPVRRRGKKKKGPAAQDNLDANEVDGPEEAIDIITTPSSISLPTPKTTTPPTLVVSDKILGFGSHGTVVYRGSLQGRAVAVKRLLRDFVTLASREVSILEESDDHPNVIRYYYQEAQANFLYIAIELCPASLADVIEHPDNFRDVAVSFEPKRALKQITSGLRHLHALKIIHRDIKPQNILVSSAKKGTGQSAGYRMLISDFGLCKKLDVDQTSFMPTAFGAMAAGTVGWRAPEILSGEVKLDVSDLSQSSRGSVGTVSGGSSGSNGAKPKKLTKSVDIFALGCLFFYVLTSGSHPYGDKFERERNILKDIKNLSGLEHFGEEGTEAVNLIDKMLDPEASSRPDTTACLTHPYFWDADRRLGFLQDASDRFEIMCREPRDPELVRLETNSPDVVGADWRARLDKAFLENLGKFRKYDGRSVQDLLRALRNKKHHYQDLPDNVKRQLHPMPEGYLSYFTRRFPRMFMHVHSLIETSTLRYESMFRLYFELNEQ